MTPQTKRHGRALSHDEFTSTLPVNVTSSLMHYSCRCIYLFAGLALNACAPSNLRQAEIFHRQAAFTLERAASPQAAPKLRAALYLDAAREASTLLDSPSQSGHSARQIYNKAAANLTILLHSSQNGSMWNRPLLLTSENSTYRLRFAKASGDGIWNPDDFTSFTSAESVDLKSIKRRNRVNGIGGALVGVQKTKPLKAFSPINGMTAPVTATLEFKGSDVTVSLRDPRKQTKVLHAGRQRVLEADFTAPLCYHMHQSELWQGLMGAIDVTGHMQTTGLYLLEPYDSDRIPVIFVHGLISTARMWRSVINELETDPLIRSNYQFMVFAYPTGNPPAYSAMLLREELAKYRQIYPNSRDALLVGHSMGGILSRMQVSTVNRSDWNIIGKEKADLLFSNMKPGDLIARCSLFDANPHIGRTIFICTPHRGSEMAVGTLGELAIRMISLPASLASAAAQTLGASTAIITGDPNRLPNSITGLSPRNPAFKVLDPIPIKVPHHSIIGDRNKGDTPNSSDGVVKYWSSHLGSAKSEKIVPGPHGACELPETIEEIRRILHLHLKKL